jgi:hypothetical protein
MEKIDDYKLTIELIPNTVWFSSVFQILKEKGERNKWQHIKEELFRIEGHRCWICGISQGRLEAHEFWEYDEKNHIQKLVAIHHLCDLCHKIKHIGFWCHTDVGLEKLYKFGLSPEVLEHHFCTVNDCNVKEFKIYESLTLIIWEERSKHQWIQDFGGYI